MKKNNDYFDITLTLLTLAILGAFAIRPALIGAIGLNKDISKYEKLRSDLVTKIIYLPEIETAAQKARDNADLLNLAIPDTPNEEALLKTFNQKAISNNLKLTSISYQFDDTNNNPKAIDISLSIEGGYPNAKQFIKDITSSTRLIEINSMSIIEKEDDKTKNSVITLSLKAKAYYSLKGQND